MSSFVKYRACFPYGSPDDESSVCLGARAQLIPGGGACFHDNKAKYATIGNDRSKGMLS